MTRIATCLLFRNGDARQAAAFYAATFADSRIDAVTPSPFDAADGDAADGDVADGGAPADLVVEFTVLGQRFIGLNGGPDATPNETVSFQVYTDDQAETDRYWAAIVDGGGAAKPCGWCRDRWGFHWQITPRTLMAAIADPDRAAAGRAMTAMMGMTRIDIAAIERARRGGNAA